MEAREENCDAASPDHAECRWWHIGDEGHGDAADLSEDARVKA